MLRINDTPKMYTWIYDISVLKHSIQGILHAIYGFKRPMLPCPEVSKIVNRLIFCNFVRFFKVKTRSAVFILNIVIFLRKFLTF